MSTQIPPSWMENLDDEDMAFIKRFLLASGSMKEVAGEYGVSYPTVRLRLDRLIQKIRLSDHTQSDPYVALIKRLAVTSQLDLAVARLLIDEYRKVHDRQQDGQLDGQEPSPEATVHQTVPAGRTEERVAA